MNKLEELQEKPRDKRTPLEQCIVDAAILEDERDGEYDVMEKAAEDLAELTEYKTLYNRIAKELNTANHRLSRVRDIVIQESFQEAVRNDPDMSAEQKKYWLSQE
jgi:hypothetical protein